MFKRSYNNIEMIDRKGFSKRMGIIGQKQMQIDDLDEATRRRLYNCFSEIRKILDKQKGGSISDDWRFHWRENILKGFFLVTDNEYYIPIHLSGLETDLEKKPSIFDLFDEKINDVFFKQSWEIVFELYEFICAMPQRDPRIYEYIEKDVNGILEEENVGYRLILGFFSGITNETEVNAIKEIEKIPFNGSKRHIEKAIQHLSDRKKPDYHNSIKESISAIESLIKEATKNDTATIQKIDQSFTLHPAFAKAIKQLYGFTSDDAGIRHASNKDSLQVDYSTAQFMLVICSAFIHFLISKRKKSLS